MAFERIGGTEIPRNHFGILDRDELADVEMAFSAFRYMQGEPEGNFDRAHLCAIHHHLFQDVYPWAGTLRNFEAQRDGNRFCAPGGIEAALDQILLALEAENHLTLTPLEELPARLAHYYTKLISVYPFPDGNGRAIRMFLELLARNLNLKLDWRNTNQVDWNNACSQGYRGHLQALTDIFQQLVTPLLSLEQREDLQRRKVEKFGIARLRSLIEAGEHAQAVQNHRYRHYDIPDALSDKKSESEMETEPIPDLRMDP